MAISYQLMILLLLANADKNIIYYICGTRTYLTLC